MNVPKTSAPAPELWRRKANSNVSILKNLASKMLMEVESMDSGPYFSKDFSLVKEVERFEMDMIRHALLVTDGHQLNAARLLGMKATTLHYKIKRFGLSQNEEAIESTGL